VTSTVALGFKHHTGWAIAVAVAGSAKDLQVLERRRIELIDPSLIRFAYHAVQDAPLDRAATSIAEVEASALECASRELRALVKSLRAEGHVVGGVGIAAKTAQLPDSLEKILSSHARLHAAEGDLYREALAEAAAACKLAVAGFPPKQLYSDAAAQLGVTEVSLRDLLSRTGKALGSPWQIDHREATLAALLASAAFSTK
jgi:hypothetical protein